MEESIYHKITAWAEGSMSNEERLAFEAEMANDPVLANEAKLVKETLQAVNEQDVINLRTTLGNIMSEQGDTPGKNSRQPFKWWILLLLAAILSATVYLVMIKTDVPEQSNEPVTPIALYEQYFPLPDQLVSISQRSETEENGADSQRFRVTALSNDLNNLFNEGRYAAARLKLDSLALIDPTHQFFLRKDHYFSEGMLALAEGQPDTALQAFSKANENMTWENIEWYTVGAYLRKGDVSKSIQLLEEISGKNIHAYKQEAEKLLEVLKGR